MCTDAEFLKKLERGETVTSSDIPVNMQGKQKSDEQNQSSERKEPTQSQGPTVIAMENSALMSITQFSEKDSKQDSSDD